MAKYNDLDMSKWKEYNDIETNSLWIIEKRDNSGAHNGYYHGNFIPQIPRQLFSRYTKEGDWILDPFCGSGTSLIEAQRMKRNSIGIEIQYDVAKDAYRRVISEKKAGVTAKILVGDSKSKSVADRLSANGIDKVQFIIFHPPYWNIIKFSEDKNDLSNCENLNSFLDAFREAVINTTNLLEKNRYCAVVMGDKYENG